MMIENNQTRPLVNRLKTAVGHLRGVQRMVESHAYCIDIIKQTQAIRRALEKVNSLLLEDHLNGEVTATLRDERQPERERVVNQLLQVFGGVRGETPILPAAASIEERIPQRLAWLEQIAAALDSIQHGLAGDTSPVEIIAQLQAMQRRLDAFQSRVLADHLNGCVTTAIRSQQPTERERVVNELLQVFTTRSTM
jgi:DNA-binding FrmR family transcriptional regulator